MFCSRRGRKARKGLTEGGRCSGQLAATFQAVCNLMVPQRDVCQPLHSPAPHSSLSILLDGQRFELIPVAASVRDEAEECTFCSCSGSQQWCNRDSDGCCYKSLSLKSSLNTAAVPQFSRTGRSERVDLGSPFLWTGLCDLKLDDITSQGAWTYCSKSSVKKSWGSTTLS